MRFLESSHAPRATRTPAARVTRVTRAAAVALLTVGVAGCDFLTGIPSVSRVELSVAPNPVTVNTNSQAIGTAFNKDGEPIRDAKRTVVFTSSDPAVATIDGTSGIIQARTVGTTVITGESGGKRDTETLVVRLAPVQQILIAGPPTQIFRMGVDATLSAVPYDSLGRAVANRPLDWKSLDETIATVTPLGIVSPRGVGETRVVASVDTGKVADTVTVRVTEVPIATVRVTPDTVVRRFPTGTVQFTATLTDALGNTVTGRTITWISENPDRVRVDANGLATAVIPTNGSEVTITARVPVTPSFGNETVRAGGAVIVLVPADRVAVARTTASARVGGDDTVTFSVRDIDNRELEGRTVRVTTASEAVATAALVPGSTGVKITGVGVGGTTVTLQALDDAGQPQGRSATINVTVVP